MKSSTTPSFRKRLRELPQPIRRLARKNFKLWLLDPHHPSLHFKKVGKFWSARVGDDFRALAMVHGGQTEWFWIGPHDDYDRLLKS
jgi:mRNA-degrading endonuclease RelE of RelBE toxin-antitoxin system